MALERIHWRHDDHRWFRMLGRGLDFWTHIQWLQGRNRHADGPCDDARSVGEWFACSSSRRVQRSRMRRVHAKRRLECLRAVRARTARLDGHIHGQADEPDRRPPESQRPRGDRLLHSRLLIRPQALDARLASRPYEWWRRATALCGSNASVGIGTSAPKARLEVQGGHILVGSPGLRPKTRGPQMAIRAP